MELQEQNGNLHSAGENEVSDTIPINSVDEINYFKMDACFTAFDKDG